jgi:excisionase family DNA binding protein
VLPSRERGTGRATVTEPNTNPRCTTSAVADRPAYVQVARLSAAAAYADVSTRTLRRYIAQGRLTGYRVGPRLVKVDLTELDPLARPIPTARGPG